MMAEFDNHFYRSSDDRLTLYARHYSANKDGTPILMMHGLTRNSADFENIAESLSQTYRLIVPDQRGRGRSDYDSNPANYTPAIYMQDMFALLHSLGVQRAILLGTSMGGLVAMLMAASRPDSAEALILNDIGPEVEPAGLERLKAYVGGPVQVTNWQEAAEHCRKTNAIALPDFDDQDWMAFARRTFVADNDGIPKIAYDMAISRGVEGDEPSAAPADLWPVWESLSDIPILAIRGETSDIFSTDTLYKMERRHDGIFKSVQVPYRGHAPMLDESTALNSIKKFLKSRQTTA